MVSCPSGPLQPHQLERFTETGGICLRGALDISPGSLLWEWRKYVLENSPTNPGHWSMPPRYTIDTQELCPEIKAAAAQLIGETSQRIQWRWTDAAIVSIGPDPDPDTARSWHIDGDFFLHFLDSPEQGLLTVVLWTDVSSEDGPTRVWIDSIGMIAEVLLNHPEGLEQMHIPYQELVDRCQVPYDLVGCAGDVYLLHPFSIHASMPSKTPNPRIISNPVIQRAEPFPLSISTNVQCPVSECTLKSIGVDKLDYRPTRSRSQRRPPRIDAWSKGRPAR